MKQYIIIIINKQQDCGIYRVDSQLDLRKDEHLYKCIEDYGFLYEPEKGDVVKVTKIGGQIVILYP